MDYESDSEVYYSDYDGSRFKFDYVQRYDGTWRAYIIDQPSYGWRNEGGHATHRYWDEDRQQYFVCWTRALYSRSDIKKVARLWAEKTCEYIATGYWS